MGYRQEAQDIYNHIRRGEDEDPKSSTDRLKEIFNLIMQFLSTCRPSEKFQFREFPRVIETSSSTGDFISGKAAMAFENLELYLMLILQNTWKNEYREIRRYGGFYQSKIEAHLNNAEEIFKLVGFRETSDDKLILTRKPSRESILAVSFECYVASVECNMIGQIQQRCGPGVTIEDILSIRRQYSGNIDKVSEYLIQKSHSEMDRLNGTATCKLVTDTEVDVMELTPDPRTNNFIGNDKVGKFQNVNIPYIDEEHGVKSPSQLEYAEGTLDDHLLASLQLVEKVKKPSEEWSYVTDSLRKRYGSAYFDGIRGDVLKHDDYKDEGIEMGLFSDRSNTVQHVPNHKTKTSHKDSGYVGDVAVSQQPVFYPPVQDIREGLQSRSGSNLIEQPTQASSAVARAQLSKSTPPAPEEVRETYMYHNPSPVIQETVHMDGEKIHLNSSYPQSRHVLQKEVLRSPQCTGYNFSHSAPMARKVADNSRNSTSTSTLSAVHARPVSQSMVESQNEWLCPHCTVANSNSDNICRVCFKSRKDGLSKSMDVRWGQKQCDKCTYLNSYTASVCEMCNTPLNEAQTALN